MEPSGLNGSAKSKHSSNRNADDKNEKTGDGKKCNESGVPNAIAFDF